MFDSVRSRLALWYVSVLSAVLIAFSAGLYALLAHNVRDRFDAELREAAEATSVELAWERAEGE